MNYWKLSARSVFIGVLINLLGLHELQSLDNGLALLPPMGWSTWNAFGCKKCETPYGTDCLSENAIQNVAELLIREGYSRLGYEYIIIDDCWQSRIRDAQHRLQPDPKVFPNGIKALAKYVHDRNLKLGIFSDLSQLTGGQYPGSHGKRYHELDAQTFADWDIDYVKMSAFHTLSTYVEKDYIHFGDALKKTNRKMVYATSWPVYIRYQVDYKKVAAHCNTWRFGGDSVASWKSILDTMDSYASKQSVLGVATSGAWNDADLLLAGKEGITLDQAKAQMAVCCIMPSPLILSTDIRTLKPEMKALLQNTNVLSVNQDSLKLPGYKLRNENDVDVWLRPIMPTVNKYHSFAIAFINRNPIYATDYSITLQDMTLDNPGGYAILDLFPSSLSATPTQVMFPSSVLHMRINPTGVVMYKAEALYNSGDTVINRNARQLFGPSSQIIRYKMQYGY